MDVRLPRLALAATLLSLAVVPAAPAHAATTGDAGPSFLGATAPTGEKPQSKLWFNDGAWWGILFRSSTSSYEIFRDEAGTWTPTGTVVDTRHSVYPDAQWDGAHLNIVSAGMSATLGVRYSRFAYDAATHRYTRDIDPVSLTTFGVETAVLDRDGAGTLWITYTHDSQVWVAHSTTDDGTWTAPFVLPGSATVTPDDISAIVRYAGHVGVMYSDQNTTTWADKFASHADGAPDNAWTISTALQGDQLSDDHINLKSLDGDPAGQVFAAVKTSLNAASDPLIKLLVLDNAGAWHDYNVFTVGDQPTRPQVEVDPLRRQVHVFASLGPCCTGGIVAVKTADLDNIAFAPGTGTTLISSDADPEINNVTLTKQPISLAMPFLPLLAGDDSTKRYWSNALALPALPPGTTPPQVTPPASKPAAKTPPADPATPEPGATASASATPLPSDAPAPARQVVVLRLPRVTRLSVMPAAFRRRGTVAFWLSRATPAVVRLERRSAGGRYVLARRYVRKGRKGANNLRVDVRRLRPGRYRALVGVPGRHAVSAAFRVGR